MTRIKIRFRLTGLLAAATLSVAAAGLVPVASASAATTIKGTVVTAGNNQRVSGASLTLYRWTGSSWVSTGLTTRSNSAGNYTFAPVASGPYYDVYGYASFGACVFNAAYQNTVATYGGWSVWFPSSTATVTATVPIGFLHYITC